MPTKVENVYVPSPPKVKGVIFRRDWSGCGGAPTDLPKTADEELTEDKYKDLGGVSDAGITNSMSRETNSIRDFGGKVVAMPQSSYTESFTLELIESLSIEALNTVFGPENVDKPGAKGDGNKLLKIKHSFEPRKKCSWVIDTVQGDSIRRQVIPIGQVVSVGDVTQINTDIVRYQISIECFETPEGYYVLELIDQGSCEDPTPPDPNKPKPPAGLKEKGTATENEFEVEWTAPEAADKPESYKVSVSPTGPVADPASPTGDDTSVKFTGATKGTKYTVSLVATKGGKDSDPATVDVTTAGGEAPTKPEAPTGVKVKGTPTSTEFSVEWTAPAGGADSYEATATDGKSKEVVTGEVTGTTAKFTVTEAQEARQFTASVVSVKGGEKSDPATSGEIEVPAGK